MPRDAVELTVVQLATRIPRSLHRRLKIHCVEVRTSISTFVIAALRERLARAGRGGRRPTTD